MLGPVGILPWLEANVNGVRLSRVNRFLGNEDLECAAVAEGIFDVFAPKQGRVLVLADRTGVSNAKMLVFALPANGRSMPFYTQVVPELAGEGALIAAEDKALQALKGICAGRSHVTVVADRGFGNKHWLGALRRAGRRH